MKDHYDLMLVGHVGLNQLHKYDGTVEPIPGGPVFHCALATTWSKKRVAVVTKMAELDVEVLRPLRDAGIDVFVSPAPQTTRGRIFYLSENPDDRRHELEATAGPFSLADMPDVDSRLYHLAGINRIEFPLEFMVGLRDRGFPFSVDMQALVRNADPTTGSVVYEDYPHKVLVFEMAEKVKLDIVEARLLVGTSDLEETAKHIERTGSREVMVTSREGALVRAKGKTFFERFTNRNDVGRTGRGDTVFASYLICRMDHAPGPSLQFAAALTSIKMETPGPFKGSLSDVLERIEQSADAVDRHG
ncbi:MAG: hypothetical protein M1274_01545 [Actinobacteria bacterium]|nr:hypothetical protein [Actinomycetota bacterium]